MVLPIFTADGGHLGFSDFYGSDFDKTFFGHSLNPVGKKTVEKPFVILFGVVRVVIYIYLPVYVVFPISIR